MSTINFSEGALAGLLELLERRNIIGWSERIRLASSPDTVSAALDRKGLYSWSTGASIRDYETLLATLERSGLITWSERLRLAGLDNPQPQGRGGR